MIREIRGKRISNGEWVKGYYLVLYDVVTTTVGTETETTKTPRNFIVPYDTDILEFESLRKEVLANSIGEKVGTVGKNSVEVYDGDIVTSTISPFDDYNGLIAYNEDSNKFIVKFRAKPGVDSNTIYQNLTRPLEYLLNANVAVIGNTVDTPSII